MTFVQSLSKISKLVFFFGISPYSFNQKTSKFECSTYSLIYTLVYFLSISIAKTYIALAFFVKGGEMLQSTFMILTLLQQTTVMIIFYSTMLDLMLKRRKHANFLNCLVELDASSARFCTNANGDNELSSLYKECVFIITFNCIVCITNSTFNLNQMQIFEHVWNAVELFQNISITMVAYYIRSFAIILHRRCSPIFTTLEAIGNDLRYNGHDRERLSDLMNCFEAFDEVMMLKKQLSDIYGLQLLFNSLFDFIILTLSVYGLLYFQTKNLTILFYFVAYNVPHGVKCVLLVLALDTLANQVLCLNTRAIPL